MIISSGGDVVVSGGCGGDDDPASSTKTTSINNNNHNINVSASPSASSTTVKIDEKNHQRHSNGILANCATKSMTTSEFPMQISLRNTLFQRFAPNDSASGDCMFFSLPQPQNGIANGGKCLSRYNTSDCVDAKAVSIHKNDELRQRRNASLNSRWRKVLYLRQGFPDNQVPEGFLRDLGRNVNLRKYKLIDCILSTGALTQQLNSIVILVSMFVFFDTYGRSDRAVSLLFAVTMLITAFLYLSTILIASKIDVFTELRNSMIFLVTGYAVSPILRTLTETISTDTIYAMVTLMMLAHLSFYDYGVSAAIVSKPISLNAAFFASVCLASRLAAASQAFAFLIFAIDIFVLSSSILYKELPGVAAKTAMTAAFTLIAIALLYACTQSATYCVAFLATISFINFGCSYGFYRMQDYKNNISGPWDEAIIGRSNFVFHDDVSLPPPQNNHPIQPQPQPQPQQKQPQQQSQQQHNNNSHNNLSIRSSYKKATKQKR